MGKPVEILINKKFIEKFFSLHDRNGKVPASAEKNENSDTPGIEKLKKELQIAVKKQENKYASADNNGTGRSFGQNGKGGEDCKSHEKRKA